MTPGGDKLSGMAPHARIAAYKVSRSCACSLLPHMPALLGWLCTAPSAVLHSSWRMHASTVVVVYTCSWSLVYDQVPISCCCVHSCPSPLACCWCTDAGCQSHSHQELHAVGHLQTARNSQPLLSLQVLWGGSGYTADIISGIDDAVKDKVDVINYSIGGGPSTVFPDAIGYAFMRAAQAGIFVAASASNSGPALGTCVNNHPWATTVAASTHNRQMIAQVRLGLIGENGKYNGSAWWWNFKDLTGRVGPALLITGNDAAVAGVAPEDAQRCFNQSLDADKVQGKIVVGTFRWRIVV